jgi:glucose-1-phosphate thymidylyltransferase
VKVVIPLAGKGSRLRPHTHVTPKPLLRVADKPVMSYILDDLRKLGVDEAVFITGHLKEKVEDYIHTEYPEFTAHFVEQAEQNGTAGAVELAREFADEDLLIMFVDTLFDADLSLVKSLEPEAAGIIWVKEVEDYQRFGVVVADEQGYMRQIIEKPSEPISRRANIGLYYIRDYKLLFEGIDHVLRSAPGASGEYYLTDAFQYMIDRGPGSRSWTSRGGTTPANRKRCWKPTGISSPPLVAALPNPAMVSRSASRFTSPTAWSWKIRRSAPMSPFRRGRRCAARRCRIPLSVATRP